MSGTQLPRLTGRMERVGEEHEPFDQFGLVGRQHAGLTAAVRLASENHPPTHNAPHGGDRGSKACSVLGESAGLGGPTVFADGKADHSAIRSRSPPERLPLRQEAEARYSRL